MMSKPVDDCNNLVNPHMIFHFFHVTFNFFCRDSQDLSNSLNDKNEPQTGPSIIQVRLVREIKGRGSCVISDRSR